MAKTVKWHVEKYSKGMLGIVCLIATRNDKIEKWHRKIQIKCPEFPNFF